MGGKKGVHVGIYTALRGGQLPLDAYKREGEIQGDFPGAAAAAFTLLQVRVRDVNGIRKGISSRVRVRRSGDVWASLNEFSALLAPLLNYTSRGGSSKQFNNSIIPTRSVYLTNFARREAINYRL